MLASNLLNPILLNKTLFGLRDKLNKTKLTTLLFNALREPSHYAGTESRSALMYPFTGESAPQNSEHACMHEC